MKMHEGVKNSSTAHSLLRENFSAVFLSLLFVLASVSVSSAIFVHEYAGAGGFPTINIIGFENGTYNSTVALNITFNVTDTDWASCNVSLVFYNATWNYTHINTTNNSVLNNSMAVIAVTNDINVDGTYYWGLNATRGIDGNTTYSGIYTYYVDTTDSSFANSSITPNSTVAGDTVTWTFNMTEVNYNVTTSKVYVIPFTTAPNELTHILNDSDSSLSFSRAGATDNEVMTVTWVVGSTVPEGNYSFMFNTTDKAGNSIGIVNSSTSSIFVNTGPTYSLWEINDTHINTSQGVMWSFNLTDHAFNSTNTVGQIIDSDGALVKTITSGNVSCATNDDARKTYACNVTWNATAEGTYFLNMTSTDTTGLTGFSHYNLTGVNVTVDDANPSTFTLTSTKYALATNYTKTNSTVTINFTVTDASYNYSNVQVYIVNASQPNQTFSNFTDVSQDQIAMTYVGNLVSAAWNSTNSDNTALDEATNYTVIVNATDMVGHSSGAAFNDILITVDNTIPAFSSVPVIDDGTYARTSVTTQTLYLNTTFVETNRYNVSFEIYNTSQAHMVLVNSTLMIDSNISLTRYRSAGFDGIYMPIGNWTVRVNVTDKAGNVASNSTTIVSNVALSATLSGSASATGIAGNAVPVKVATFTMIAKGYQYVGGYLTLTGPGGEAYINNESSIKRAFISNVTASPAAGDMFLLGGNSSYLNPADETIALIAVTPSDMSGTIYNHDVCAGSVYTDLVYMYLTPYVSEIGAWTGPYGFGLFTTSS